MTYKIDLSVTLRPSILDPQGKASQHALSELGYSNVEEVRIGKFVELRIEAENEETARQTAVQACEKLLANPVMEDYTLHLVEEAVDV